MMLPFSKEDQDKATPRGVLKELMDGNSRFLSGSFLDKNIHERIAFSSGGQYPRAVILSCIDSRVPVEQIFDQGIGDVFVARVAGNVVNDDLLGSMEFATKVASVKLVMVLGHSKCGAVMGACGGVKLGKLSGLLEKIDPSIEMTKTSGLFSESEISENGESFIEEVIRNNVRCMVGEIRERSFVISDLERGGNIGVVGAYYDISSGVVSLLE